MKSPALKLVFAGILDGAHCSPVLSWLREGTQFTRAARALPSISPADVAVASVCCVRFLWGLAPSTVRRDLSRRLWVGVGRPDKEHVAKFERIGRLVLDLCDGYLVCPLLLWLSHAIASGSLPAPGLHELLALGVLVEMTVHCLHGRHQAHVTHGDA